LQVNALGITRCEVNDPHRSATATEPDLKLTSQVVAPRDIYKIKDRLTGAPPTIITSNKSALYHRSLGAQQLTMLLKRYTLFNAIDDRCDISLSWP